MAALFAYGSLVVDEVLLGVLGRLPERTPWSVVGWRAARLHGVAYPGLVPGDGEVPGVLVRGLTEHDWELLDAYETSDYDRRPIGEQDGEPVLAYVWTALDRVSEDDWDLERFRHEELSAYLAREGLA